MNEQLKLIISAEVAKFKKGVDDAKKEVKTFKQQVADAGKNIESTMKAAGSAIATHIKNGAKAAAKGLAALGAALVGAAVGTEEYRQNMAQLNASFEQSGFSAGSAKEAYNELYKVIGESDQATESAANIAMLADSEEEVVKWSRLASGVLGTFHDTLQPEAFYEAANETLKLGEATGAFTQMLEQTGVMSVEEFNKQMAACKTETEKQALMLKVSEKAMGKAGEAYNKNAENIQKQREAQARLTDTLAKVGEAVSPVITLFTDFAAKALERVAPVVEELAKDLVPVLGAALQTAADITGKIIGFVVDNWGTIAAIAGVVAGICAAIGIYNTVAAVKAAMDAAQVTTIWGLVSAHIAQAAAAMAAIAPYVLIVAAIAAVIAIIVLCIKHWDDIVAVVKKAIDAIINTLAGVASWINTNVVQPIAKFIGGLWDGFKNGAKAAWDAVKSIFSGLANFFKNIFSTAWEGVKKVFSTGGAVFKGIAEGILNVFKKVVNSLITGINNVVALPFKGLNSILNTIQNVNIVGIKPFNWLTWRAPVPQIPYLAKGGVIDSATLAMIGEQGKEAVVPLENNLQWLDRMATMLSSKLNNNNTPIVLKVGEKVFAQTAIKSINDLTRQQGELSLILV